MQDAYLKGFKAYLQLERSMSDNTIDAYLHDVSFLRYHLSEHFPGIGYDSVKPEHLRSLLTSIADMELSAGTQARVLSGIRSFYRYMAIEEIVRNNPTELVEVPKLKRALPHVLSVAEIDLMMNQIDHSKPDGQRNRAMIEVMYCCGLRVSELTDLRISCLHLDAGFIRVIGKGNKERLIPIGDAAARYINIYRELVRVHLPVIKPGQEDFLFLNRRGSKLSRVMVFMIIKDLAARAGLSSEIHPHTLRHSFATHLVEAGADLRAVQEMMGHKSITTTEIYSHLDRTYLRDTLNRYHPHFNNRQN